MNCPSCNKTVPTTQRADNVLDKEGRWWHSGCAMEKLGPVKTKHSLGCPECGKPSKMADFHDSVNRGWHSIGKSCVAEALARLLK